MKRMLVALTLMFLLALCIAGQGAKWRQATEKELKGLIPSRATVEKERIETEMRTASGVTDGSGHFIAGVVLITAGYAAEGKYSHLFITQVPMKFGDVKLNPGEYVFGTKRIDNDTLEISFYEGATGKPLGTVGARRDSKQGPISSLHLSPGNGDKPALRIGRFSAEYSILK